ncbi:site-specific integrase [Kaistella yonginensis]|uniref:site-specific integrase n=1 Tax=Kaistella yonginensis TaxID=658267 RepID=UPI0025B359C4|nr:site-specific integrase [Kaistella yonginensis]MDN3606716.1 phage integrase SAM-like domain-containing protein [Kaistella yonginensis]
MKITFELRKEKVTQDGLIPIQIVVRAEGIRIRKNTGFSTKEVFWNGSRVKPGNKREDNNYQVINDELQKLEGRVSDIFLFLRINKLEFSKKLFLEKYESKEEITVSPELDFFKCFDDYIDKGKPIKTYNTIKGQVTVRNYIEIFAREKGFKITFDIIDEDFFDLLRDYSYKTKEIKQNYFCKIIKVLKSFLNWATDKGYNTTRDFEKFKASDHDIDIIYLSFEELMKLYKKDMKSDKLSQVRDFYCMGCFTGLRFSDLSKLHLANISDDHIVISIQKTKTQNHAIKLNKYAKEILNKYKGTIYEPLPVISSQKFNEYIKDCCELAEINQSFTIHWFVGNQKKSLTQPKHRFITSHTARKTFITNSLLLGMEPKAIKKIANIKKDAVLDKYMKVTEAFTDEQMDKAWG